MSKFRKKPVVVDAIQITSDMVLDNCLPDGVILSSAEFHKENRTVSSFRGRIQTLEGDHQCGIGDWVITGVKGEKYSCKPDIFEMTYEPLTLELKPASVI